MRNKYYIYDDWKLKIDPASYSSLLNKKVIKAKEWIEAEIPGTVHTDLLKSEIIPDPFFADNELRLQWISESDWIYKTQFNFPKDFNKDEPVYLVFDGIDTIADIFFNNIKIGHAENMFLKYEFDISSQIKKKKNELHINFKSALKYGRSLEDKFGVLPVALNSERVYIRKAQYSFGWDWGPEFATVGIWKNVYLTQKPEYWIENIKFDTIEIDSSKAICEARTTLNRDIGAENKVVFHLSIGEKTIIKTVTGGGSEIKTQLEVPEPELWWPNNYGAQNLYLLKIQIINPEGNIIDESLRKVGIRKIELILEDNGQPQFRFNVNGNPVFAKGANWIPSDSFIPRIPESKYRYLIEAAKKANMNILRVWGGGFYENEIFYELCDELGLMVWQDFMFACASYPEHDSFIENVKEEILQNVNTLQHHACLAIWCGNNENEWIWYRENGTSCKNMPGYRIYHEVIPGLIKQLDPLRPYWPSSPFGNDEDPDSEASGNRHQWDIWSSWTDYTKVVKDESLFVTEFGFQSSACTDTIKKILPKAERNSQSRLFEFHNKQIEGPERLFKFMSAHLPVRTGMDDFVYLTQLNQGLALRECVEHWQARFPRSNGSIIWQLNDCWPVASWSLIDSGLMPKLSYYMVKRSFNPELIFFLKQNGSLKISVRNSGLKNFSGILEIKYVGLPSSEIENVGSKKIKIDSLKSREIFSLRIPEELKEGKAIIIATLFNENNERINRNFYKETEWKYIRLPDAVINTSYLRKKEILKVKADKPAFFVHLENSSAEFEDNGFILLPGEEMQVGIKIKNKKTFKKKFVVNSLNQYLK